MTELLKREYADIVCMTLYGSPNYEIIDFQKFLSKRISYNNNFVGADMIKSLRDKIIGKYKNDKICFTDFGTLSEISFKELYYYQNEIGITGPKYSTIDEPVAILRVDDKYILWNGYHRALLKIMKNRETIKGYILTVPN